MQVINKKTALEIIKNTNGKVFSVVFTKKDGTVRHMNCRTGVKKHVKGVGLAFDPSEKDLVGVFDMKNNGYRFINLQTIKGLQVSGEFYTIGE
jgi:hypothetical protein